MTFSFGGELKRPAKPTTTDSHSKKDSVSERNREYRPEWEKDFDWLRFDENNKKMYCALCRECKKTNSFTKGCENFRKSAMTEHEETNDHQLCVKAPEERENLEEIEKRIFSEQERGAHVAARAAHWIVTENLPLSKYKSLIGLLKDLNTPDVCHLQVSDKIGYDSSDAFDGFLEAMSQVVEEQIQEEMTEAEIMTVLVD